LVRPSAGKIYLEESGLRIELAGRPPEAIVDLGVALVPEGRRLFPKLTVEENLLLGAYRRAARADRAVRLGECYDSFPRLRDRRRQLAGSMSGGEQQMLALARALMSAPRILLIDEPSVGLAPMLVSRMIDTIAQVKERYALSVLMAEQNFHQAVRIADRGYVLVHGEIAFEGRNADDLRNSALVKTYYLGA
jgi:branched-chain amino acid transport system ATP-binding protein